MAICPNCNNIIPAGIEKCDICGKQLFAAPAGQGPPPLPSDPNWVPGQQPAAQPQQQYPPPAQYAPQQQYAPQVAPQPPQGHQPAQPMQPYPPMPPPAPPSGQGFPPAYRIKRRGPAAVLVLSVITLGIYYLYWIISTKDEINSMGASIPTGWMMIIPIANIYFIYKYCEAFCAKFKTGNDTVVWFLLMWLISPIGAYLTQKELDRYANC